VRVPIDVNKRGARVVSDCAELIVYWRGSVHDRAEAIEHFYRGALQRIRPGLKWYETASTGEVRRAKPATPNLLPQWLKKPRARRGMMGLILETAADAASSSNLAFSIFCDEEDPQPMGYIRLVTPADALERDPSLFLETALHLVDGLDFESGTAGYAVNWDSRSELSELAGPHLERIAAAYPGVEISDPNTTLIALQDGKRPAFKRVNWITLLGRRLGRVATLPKADKRLDIRVSKLAKGWAIIAGAAPRRSGDLAAYRKVGKALAKWRVAEHAPVFGDDDKRHERWLAAFDRVKRS
jgi:hypothetical protein